MTNPKYATETIVIMLIAMFVMVAFVHTVDTERANKIRMRGVV